MNQKNYGVPFPEIVSAINRSKRVSSRQVRRYLDRLSIRPLGIRQRPNRYPMDTVDRVLESLGLATSRTRIVSARDAIRAGKGGAK